MSHLMTTLLLLILLLALLSEGAYAFGAGSIPSYAFLHDRAFRHGDIENILSSIAKTPHHHTGGSGGLFDFFSALTTKGISAMFLGNAAQTFTKSDIRRIYFGNWLRDYSQAIDVSGLSKMTAETLLIIVQALGFMSFGFATREFHITPERLGVYLPVEHIDNPKGYAEKEGDARRFHPKLRPPVNPKELDIDESTGMKKYMATEGHSWDTSTAHIRRLLRECIALGRKTHLTRHGRGRHRQANAYGDPDDCEEMWEAYRLLGSALHTLEDLLAHSNWCEIALRKLGCEDVFCHVGEKVLVRTPSGLAPPLVTGTFGSADFLHSLLGEASDHLSQASVVDLTIHMEEAETTSSFTSLRTLLASLPSFLNPSQEVAATEELEERAKAHHFGGPPNFVTADTHSIDGHLVDSERADITNYAPPAEVQQFLWDVLTWRDGLMRGVVSSVESVPGLSDLLEQLIDVLNQCVYTLLAPALIPIIKEVTLALKEQSQAVIDTEEQYEVFDDPYASDPTHSILAKDHVDLILNEPAGRVAQTVVENTVKLVVQAWYDHKTDPERTIGQILEAFHHPYYAAGKSQIQNDMLAEMKQWLDDFKRDGKDIALSGLTKDSIREGINRRIASLASSTEDTLSSLEGTDEDYNSALEDSRRNSDAEGESILDMEAPLDRDRERVREHGSRVREGYKTASKSTRASEAADMRARVALARNKWERGSLIPLSSGAGRNSDADYQPSDDDCPSQATNSEYEDASEVRHELQRKKHQGLETATRRRNPKANRGGDDDEYVLYSESEGENLEEAQKRHNDNYLSRLLHW